MVRKFVIAALTLVVLELGARAYLFSGIPDDQKPRGASVRAALFFSGGSYVGEFRGQRYLFRKPADTFRILALGGSATAGVRGDEETWPRKLEIRLNRAAPAGRRFEVINLGQQGATSAQEFFYFVTHRYLDPDLVIVYDGYNDLVYSNAQSAHYLMASVKTYELLAKPWSAASVASWLYRHSALVNRVDVYLYRLKNSLNSLIMKRRWFGLGSQARIRAFENIEWYARRLELEPHVEKTRTVDASSFEKAALDPASRKMVDRILSEAGGTIGPDAFVARLAESPLEEPAKRRVLSALGLDRLTFKIGDLSVEADVLELTGRRKDADLFPEVYRYSLDNLAAELKRRRVKGIFVQQAFLPEKLRRLSGSVDGARLAGLSNFKAEEDAHFASLSDARTRLMSETASKHGVEFADARGAFDAHDDRKVYLDNCHNTEEGLDILAGEIERALVMRGLLGAGARA